MANQRKPSMVFVHGLWADGSCFAKLIPTLQEEGFEVIASQHGLDSHDGDVTTVKRTLGRVQAPARRRYRQSAKGHHLWAKRLGRGLLESRTGVHATRCHAIGPDDPVLRHVEGNRGKRSQQHRLDPAHTEHTHRPLQPDSQRHCRGHRAH